jgi:hypothetical protein
MDTGELMKYNNKNVRKIQNPFVAMSVGARKSILDGNNKPESKNLGTLYLSRWLEISAEKNN